MSLLSFESARDQLLAAVRQTAPIEVPLLAAHGRVLACHVTAPMNVPRFDNSAMDGYALAMPSGAVPDLWPVVGRIAAGSTGPALAPGQAARIFTGAPIPAGATTVVMQEHVIVEGDFIRVQAPVLPGQNIRRAGEDIAVGSTVLAAGMRLTPPALALLASIGVAQIETYSPLKVGVFSTGDEIVEPGEPLPPGGVYNSNRYALIPQLAAWGCEVTDYGQVADDLAATQALLAQAADENDVVITTGGVSVGEEDHVKAAVLAQGALDVWKIAIKPGKPLAFGRVGQAAFVGLPGNPVSVFVTLAVLVRPFLLASMGLANPLPRPLTLTAAFDWTKPDRRREFLRAQITADGQLVIYPKQGSGVMTSVAWADGLVDVAPEQVIKAGDIVMFYPWAALGVSA